MTQHSTKRTILIVEDDADDRLMLRRLLSEHAERYEIVEAQTGGEAAALSRERRFDCILLDYFLPDTTGRALLDELVRGGEDGATVAVAVLTSVEDNSVAAEVLARGAQDYLVKGTVTAHGLSRAIENAIEKSSIHRELEAKRDALELRNFQLESLRDELQQKLGELSNATRAKEQFLAVMSHEMRTPLNAILGYVDLMEMGIGGSMPEQHRTNLERIRMGGRHLLDLINDVLDLARTDADKLEIDLRPVDLSAVLDEISALLERQAQAKRLELVVEPCGPEIPYVQADLRRVRQILTNLIGNAVKFTDRGSIRVRCRLDGVDHVAVDVEDTGIGVPDELLDLIFTEFYQARGELTREKGGSGLGLAISQRLAQLMDGSISVASRETGGSVFTLRLPIAPTGGELRGADVDAHTEFMSARDTVQAAEEPAAVVVAAFGADPEALAELASRVEPVVQLKWTTDPDALLGLATREAASLVVLDIACKKGVAWRIAHAIPDIPELASTAVLLLPRLPQAENVDGMAGLDLGWVSLIPKPYTDEQLSQAVSRAAESAQNTSHETGAAERKLEVLVVDDDPDSRRVAADILRATNLLVREAADGESALGAMRRQTPDVVVLDLMMPVLDGFGVLAAMRADPRLNQVPVVVLSAKSLSDAERHYLARTAVRVLEKGQHRLADVAALVLRAAGRAAETAAPPPGG
jgi:signal transduction histidine kinase